MTVQELATKCVEAMSRGSRSIVFDLPRHPRRGGNTRRLLGRQGPVGEVVADTDKGQVVAFDPVKILAYLCAKGLVKVQNGDLGSPT